MKNNRNKNNKKPTRKFSEEKSKNKVRFVVFLDYFVFEVFIIVFSKYFDVYFFS